MRFRFVGVAAICGSIALLCGCAAGSSSPDAAASAHTSTVHAAAAAAATASSKAPAPTTITTGNSTGTNGTNTSTTRSKLATVTATTAPTTTRRQVSSMPYYQPSNPATVAPPTLLWSDEFNGTAGSAPNPANWNIETGGSGWGNNELECYTNSPSNVAQDGAGDLVITARQDIGHVCSDGSTNDYTSARLDTEGKVDAEYGLIEMRAKLPVGSGTWPAFWALGSNYEKVGWPGSGEIDIMEVIGSEPTIVHGTLHGPMVKGYQYGLSQQTDTQTDLSASFHTYGVEWGPTSVTFLLDGKVYATATEAAVKAAGGTWVFTHSFFLLLNLAVGGNWPGAPDSAATWPQTYTIDWVRVYSQ